jgi:hypothetical protein
MRFRRGDLNVFEQHKTYENIIMILAEEKKSNQTWINCYQKMYFIFNSVARLRFLYI